MRTSKQIAHSNKILLGRLLHLSRIVLFASLPIALHVDHLEYMRDFYRFPLLPGDPIPTPSPYPIVLVFMAIAVIGLDLTVLWKLLRRNNGYEILAAGLIVIEVLLLLTIPDYRIFTILGVLVLGLLEMLLLREKTLSNLARSTTFSKSWSIIG